MQAVVEPAELEDLRSDYAWIEGALSRTEREARSLRAQMRELKEKIALLEQGQLSLDIEGDGPYSDTEKEAL